MKRVDIKASFSCNNYCKFCAQGNKRDLHKDLVTNEVKKILRQARRDCNEVVFTGGEVSVRKDIFDLISYARELKFKHIQLQTNGRMFCYLEFCKKAVSAGASEFGLALHGHTQELHDYLTGAPGSFKQTTSGIANLKILGQRVSTNTVITKPNYRHLPEIAQLLARLKVDQFQFAFVHPMGTAGENFKSIVPRMALIEPYVKKGLRAGIKAGIKVMTEAIPYCFMAGYEEYIAEGIIPNTKIYDANLIINDFTKVRQKEGKAKGPLCKTCRYYNTCEGPWKEYPQKYGWREFVPV